MKILSIETSCDETAIAILEGQGTRVKGEAKFKLLSNVVLSQIKIHQPFGGVVPNLAKREHQKNLVPILLRALKSTHPSPNPLPLCRGGGEGVGSSSLKKVSDILIREPELLKIFIKKILPLKKPNVDAIAITHGPGLEPALWVGVNFAKALAYIWKKPIVAVNHLEGHIYASFLPKTLLRRRTSKSVKTSDVLNPQFPLLALIVSGGHTELVLMKKHLSYQILGETCDDAAGEAFDKVAKMLNLGYPGGPEISRLAEKFKSEILSTKSETNPKYKIQNTKYLFPRPMINSTDLNFSFSGLKTAVLYHLRNNPNANKAEAAYEFEKAVVDVLVAKTIKALKKYKVKSFVLGGGVAANSALRHALETVIRKHNLEIRNSKLEISLHLSPLWLTGDNAAMIAVPAFFKATKKQFADTETLRANGTLKLGGQ